MVQMPSPGNAFPWEQGCYLSGMKQPDPTQATTEELLTRKQVSQRWKCCVETLKRRERAGNLPFVVLGSRLKAWAARNLPRSQARWAAAQVVSWSPLGPKESDRPVRSVFPPGTSHRCGRLTRVGRGFSVLVCPTLLVFEAAARTAKIIKRADLLTSKRRELGLRMRFFEEMQAFQCEGSGKIGFTMVSANLSFIFSLAESAENQGFPAFLAASRRAQRSPLGQIRNFWGNRNCPILRAACWNSSR